MRSRRVRPLMVQQPRLHSMAQHHDATPPTPVRALDADGYGVVAVGTTLWVSAALAGLAAPSWFTARGLDDWVAVCLSGAGLGVIGLLIIRRRRRRGVRL